GGGGGALSTTGGAGGASTGTATAKEGLAGTAQEYGQKLTEAATTAKDYVSDKISVAGDKLKDLQNVDYKQVAEDAKNYAREKPGQALLISAAAGFLIGLLLKSSNRR
ncbi:MAG: C-terminal glycine zipper region, partial [Pyrinomonadaceae bacterium]|nr:C-terminal glycine zipper region [Pyrinomonadaceae bacterium]